MKHKSMRPALFLLLALLLSASTLIAVVNGTEPALEVGEHIGAAILISWLAVGTVGYTVDRYRAHALMRSRPRRSS
jgi:Ca2+/Na+ antiporter